MLRFDFDFDFRLEPPMTWENIPEVLLQDLAQLVKANSIEGNKKNNVVIIYTPWSNIKVCYANRRKALHGTEKVMRPYTENGGYGRGDSVLPQ